MATALHWIPDSLYNLNICTVVSNYNYRHTDLHLLPDNVRFDIYYELYNQGRLCDLAVQYRKLDVFTKMLTVGNKRHLLHHCFQALMDHGSRVSSSLTTAYSQYCQTVIQSMTINQTPAALNDAIRKGFSLGGFLNDAGWLKDCETVLLACLQLCKLIDNVEYRVKAFNCCIRLLHVRNAFYKFCEAEVTYQECGSLAERLRTDGLIPNMAALYAEFSLFYFVRSYYNEAHKLGIEAIKELNPNLPPKIIIDVLRQAAKACVVKREFKRSELLIKQAVFMARDNFGPLHPKYSDTLVDFGFYLLNVDCVAQSVQIYQTALDIRTFTFGGKNVHVAIAHEDLAYALYVNEYSSGKFVDAHSHAEKAMDIMGHLLPPDHLLFASSKRVKALILEEMAIDNNDKEAERRQLLDAQDLHLSALELARKAFGEHNVQTAKHYGNLGRLYQSMNRYEEAEQMHLKAIAIKEQLLGLEDYEVALSVGHLASLYNYDMKKYEQARDLYIRSIAIGKKLFGNGYSGLEYDYRGLIRVYNILEDYAKVSEYNSVYHQWKQLRNSTEARQGGLVLLDFAPLSIADIVNQFMQLEHSHLQSPVP